MRGKTKYFLPYNECDNVADVEFLRIYLIRVSYTGSLYRVYNFYFSLL